MARHKPTAEGGYPRGEETRARLIDAAVRVFGEKGYDAASTREIASVAGLNAPALQYYFDNKEGVYLACVEHMIERLWEQVGPAVAVAEAVLEVRPGSDAERIEALLGIFSGMLGLILDGPDSPQWREFMSRQQAGQCPPSAHALMKERFKMRMSRVIRGLVSSLTGYAEDDERTVLHSFALFAQVVAFRVQRPSLLDSLGWDGVDADRLARVRAVLLAHVRAALEGLVRERDAGV
ncbi:MULTISPECIES: CerR family C-terminal domain-containing protein [unclassified Pseudomonas]|uniref:CerR family C-terminal domain-containing protein n=1 Tax=unclassified Pseudomonas TaxID=196821 RepID=UPI000BCD83F3|nr:MULTISPECIES: CerR family C-terminal domain-containing protein [unclassified Pseudomonas]PVZ20070.1 TetR family transcriptional regulator [Pseudomonas sp. URIL14HWK12:I12]PVZ27136.1 TetR family transcriptional regulator [Pseudomonas sp. URIL14HWK12:I10]PVZ38025.1 TetR family transcriptional regulator [Pseudomonas sp. URIL14HWK12:I11]SNZ04783.1 transcriptional regulator, TetR family [Pseudomonas sp. URIL14HWK12:I9]